MIIYPICAASLSHILCVWRIWSSITFFTGWQKQKDYPKKSIWVNVSNTFINTASFYCFTIVMKTKQSSIAAGSDFSQSLLTSYEFHMQANKLISFRFLVSVLIASDRHVGINLVFLFENCWIYLNSAALYFKQLFHICVYGNLIWFQ